MFTLKIADKYVILNSINSTKIVAVPHYNLTFPNPLAPEKGGTYPVQSSSSSGGNVFSKSTYWTSEPYLTLSRNIVGIPMDHEENNIQKYIKAYSEKLSIATDGKITARIARKSEFDDSSIELPEQSTITKAEIRNPSGSKIYWLGSLNTHGTVWCVLANGSIDWYSYWKWYWGARPLIEIDIT